ncbi:hypothetical protein OI25_7247 [Paraburkholderia fungorum]|jgi:hypothetical protein|uniref:Uncharacterized protein n=1 Tax=Paraburkholderia fungorum TaxID=134537 RepID=A0AAP5UY44_9BURK|nr:hypothetical protein [Paraburkholderia fungorum]AJZ56543.1 hypothetical protein OI25_7247 [Paraburkholderia fungorum]MDT8842666.1 hypothetical protein [Paraburkholderia fungorum]PRZ49231.1 hypothetical protein BX589_126140 [Paraburkholderia fungorum]
MSKHKIGHKRIQELKDGGFVVHMVSDQEPVLYGWLNTKSGASQGEYKERQPFRRTKEQAWADCEAFDSCEMPMAAEPDWTQDHAKTIG